MAAGIESSFEFANLQGLAGLRNASDSPEARRAVAQQFESLFISMMLRQMRTASTIDGGLIDNEKLEMHQSLYDQQLALSLSRGRGIGLAESILRSFGDDSRSVLPAGEPGPVPAWRSFDGPGTSALLERPAAQALAAAMPTATAATTATMARASENDIETATGTATAATSTSNRIRADDPADGEQPAEFAVDSPEAFVQTIWPHAERAARELGTVPEILVAQAALETGWGQSLMRSGAADPSFNLFGIKADATWSGPRAVVSTLEFVGGVPERRREPFRVYASVGESFADYVELIRTRPRYRDAMNAGSPAAYAQALQSAGYATDPAYARKLIGILERGLPGQHGFRAQYQVAALAADTPVGDVERVISGELEGS